jgi:hypothetical protein
MTLKNALILGGAILLAAGCSSSVTSPIAKVDTGPASALSGKPALPTPKVYMPQSATASDSTSCRGAYPVSSGFADTTCVIE